MISMISDIATVVAADGVISLANISFDFRFRVDEFLQKNGKSAEIEVADDGMRRVGDFDCYFGRLVHGVAEFPAAGKGPCVFADSEEEKPERQAGWQEFKELLEYPWNTDFEKIAGCPFS